MLRTILGSSSGDLLLLELFFGELYSRSRASLGGLRRE